MEKNLEPSILEGSQKGNRNCQELLYKHFYSYGMSICLRYTGSREEAVEVLNDGFLKVFQNLHHFDLEKPFKNWFRQILINTSINHFKKTEKYRRQVDLDHLKDFIAFGANGQELLQYQDTIKLIQSLSPNYRTVFNMYVLEGYTHEEIAEMLGISVGTSKSNLSRARENLRSFLKKSYEKRFERQ